MPTTLDAFLERLASAVREHTPNVRVMTFGELRIYERLTGRCFCPVTYYVYAITGRTLPHLGTTTTRLLEECGKLGVELAPDTVRAIVTASDWLHWRAGYDRDLRRRLVAALGLPPEGSL